MDQALIIAMEPMVLGSMSNARMLNLYDLNNLDPNNGASIRRRLRTVHHEFMHSLNQTVPIPLAYQSISGADYDPSWAGKSEDQVRPLGFVSPYSSSAYTEDFAEMLAHIVVEGRFGTIIICFRQIKPDMTG